MVLMRLLLLVVLLFGKGSAFVGPHQTSRSLSCTVRTLPIEKVVPPHNHHNTRSYHHIVGNPNPTTVALEAASSVLPVTALVRRSPITTGIALAAVFVTALLMKSQHSPSLLLQRFLYPGSLPDPAYTQPLPPGTIGGCPLLGGNPFMFYRNLNHSLSTEAAKLSRGTQIWKRFGFGKPMAVVSGSANIKNLLAKEFTSINQATDFGSGKYVEMIFGTESMAFETSSADRYRFLQRLVGQALTPASVARGIPALQQAAERAVDQMVSASQNNGKAKMDDICKDLTLDVAWRQIIGLKFESDDEVASFHQAVHTWLKSITNFLYFLLPVPTWMLKRSKAYRAKQYLTQLIEQRIDQLQASGVPDGSTLSAMVFATDNDGDGDDNTNNNNGSNKLTRQQVIDNVFLLIIAGTETSSNTLTNAMLLLGMHPQSWNKLVQEQEQVVAQFGPDLTKEQLDKECPYLDGVVRETMRLLPISGGGMRQIDETTVLEGYQIPKKWWTMYSVALTHEQDPKTYKPDGSHMDIQTGFQPERWLNEATRPTTEFLPYGAGSRFCLGHNLANAEMRTFLAVMARRLKGFELQTDPKKKDIQWKEGVIITPKDGVLVTAQAK